MKIKSHYLSILEPFLLEVLCLRIFFLLMLMPLLFYVHELVRTKVGDLLNVPMYTWISVLMNHEYIFMSN